MLTRVVEAGQLWRMDDRMFYILDATCVSPDGKDDVFDYLEIDDDGLYHFICHMTMRRNDLCYDGVTFASLWERIF